MPEPVDVHVRWAHTGALTDAHLELLDPTERERWVRFRQSGDRERFALGSIVVRRLVAELDATVPEEVTLDRTCPRCGGQHGPVTTPGRGWRCSVAHSGPFAVAAVVHSTTAGATGVDLETRCPPDWVELLRRVLAPDEVAPVDEAGFLTLWTRKEAVVKAAGDGLTRPMSSFSVSDATGLVQLSGEARALQLTDLDVGPLRGAVPGTPVAAALAVSAEHVRVHWQRARL